MTFSRKAFVAALAAASMSSTFAQPVKPDVPADNSFSHTVSVASHAFGVMVLHTRSEKACLTALQENANSFTFAEGVTVGTCTDISSGTVIQRCESSVEGRRDDPKRSRVVRCNVPKLAVVRHQ